MVRSDADRLRTYLEGGGYAPVREREVYRLTMVDGLSLWHTARTLGIGFETVREYLSRLRRRVADAARAHEDDRRAA